VINRHIILFFKYFIDHAKVRRAKRPLRIEGIDVDEYIQLNADPIWFHENEMWENIKEDEDIS